MKILISRGYLLEGAGERSWDGRRVIKVQQRGSEWVGSFSQLSWRQDSLTGQQIRMTHPDLFTHSLIHTGGLTHNLKAIDCPHHKICFCFFQKGNFSCFDWLISWNLQSHPDYLFHIISLRHTSSNHYHQQNAYPNLNPIYLKKKREKKEKQNETNALFNSAVIFMQAILWFWVCIHRHKYMCTFMCTFTGDLHSNLSSVRIRHQGWGVSRLCRGVIWTAFKRQELVWSFEPVMYTQTYAHTYAASML